MNYAAWRRTYPQEGWAFPNLNGSRYLLKVRWHKFPVDSWFWSTQGTRRPHKERKHNG
jgi:hypothetical protein